MPSVERLATFTLAPACVAVDFWFASSRCLFSPSVQFSALAVAAALQVVAVAVPIIIAQRFAGESAKFRIRGASLATLTFLLSLPVMETALLYGDAIGREKGFHSSGLKCIGHAPMFSDGT